MQARFRGAPAGHVRQRAARAEGGDVPHRHDAIPQPVRDPAGHGLNLTPPDGKDKLGETRGLARGFNGHVVDADGAARADRAVVVRRQEPHPPVGVALAMLQWRDRGADSQGC